MCAGRFPSRRGFLHIGEYYTKRAMLSLKTQKMPSDVSPTACDRSPEGRASAPDSAYSSTSSLDGGTGHRHRQPVGRAPYAQPSRSARHDNCLGRIEEVYASAWLNLRPQVCTHAITVSSLPRTQSLALDLSPQQPRLAQLSPGTVHHSTVSPWIDENDQQRQPCVQIGTSMTDPLDNARSGPQIHVLVIGQNANSIGRVSQGSHSTASLNNRISQSTAALGSICKSRY
jgi:hypothetical protein